MFTKWLSGKMRGPWFIACVDFYGVNTLFIANFRSLMWSQPACKIPKNVTLTFASKYKHSCAWLYVSKIKTIFSVQPHGLDHSLSLMPFFFFCRSSCSQSSVCALKAYHSFRVHFSSWTVLSLASDDSYLLPFSFIDLEVCVCVFPSPTSLEVLYL